MLQKTGNDKTENPRNPVVSDTERDTDQKDGSSERPNPEQKDETVEKPEKSEGSTESEITTSGSEKEPSDKQEAPNPQTPTTPQTPQPPKPTTAQGYLDAMTLEEKVYQMFIVLPEQLTGVSTATQAGRTTKNAIQKYPMGGIIYMANIQTTDMAYNVGKTNGREIKALGFNRIIQAVKNGTISKFHINESVLRMLKTKMNNGIM